MAAPGMLPLGNMGSLVGLSFSLSSMAPVPGSFFVNPHAACSQAVTQVSQDPSIPRHGVAAAAVQKLIMPKIQDELIAREIVINDAEPSVRYKLTKRQIQEEIQKCTGAVVITRGKYRPPNALPDGEKPLYLHISAGAHLKETAERIKTVDHAAAMVEEMLKQGPNSLQIPTMNDGVKVLNTCVFLGFDADPALNIAACIRGPNDQYINHIMTETGATVLLRGCASGDPGSSNGDEQQQPLHLLLSSSNSKSLEDAKLLAENLLDTISAECGISRVSSSKVYNAVPPPPNLLAGSSSAGSIATPVVPGDSVSVSKGGVLNCGLSQVNMGSYSQPPLSSGTCYDGYAGIYPQTTPLQQVALALRRSQTPVSSSAAPATAAEDTTVEPCVRSVEKEKRPQQKRKFQEVQIVSRCPAKLNQRDEYLNPSASTTARNTSTMPAPKKLVRPSSDGIMPPPPPRSKPSIPPPPLRAMPPSSPNFNPSTRLPEASKKNDVRKMLDSVIVPDTLMGLMEYGEEDDEVDEDAEEPKKSVMAPKPFWAV